MSVVIFSEGFKEYICACVFGFLADFWYFTLCLVLVPEGPMEMGHHTQYVHASRRGKLNLNGSLLAVNSVSFTKIWR